MGDQTLTEFIRKVGSQYVVFPEDGKRLGSVGSKAAAVIHCSSHQRSIVCY
jgi:hypothetical protein